MTTIKSGNIKQFQTLYGKSIDFFFNLNPIYDVRHFTNKIKQFKPIFLPNKYYYKNK